MTHIPPIDTAPREVSPEEAAAGFRAVANLFARWELSDAQAAKLLDVSTSTYRRWSKEGPGRISRDNSMRLGTLLDIHKALRTLFHEPSRGYAWIKKPSDAFGGKSALDVMMNGYVTDLLRVRSYLDAESSGG